MLALPNSGPPTLHVRLLHVGACNNMRLCLLLHVDDRVVDLRDKEITTYLLH